MLIKKSSEFILIDSFTSKKVLSSIMDDKKINLKKLKLENFEKKITQIRKDYLIFKKKLKITNFKYKNYIFWELIKKKFNIKNIILKERNQKKKAEKVNILFSEFTKALGFTPSLLFLLIYQDKIKKIIEGNKILEEITQAVGTDNINNEERLRIINALVKKKISLITPLCPDYEHIKISSNFYRYTFNKLNEGIGLIGKKLVSNLDKVHNILRKNKIKFTHYLQYGDFESFSKDICQRLKISEKEFITKLCKSITSLKKHTNKNCKISMIVKELTTKKNWIAECNKNEKKLRSLYNTDLNYKRLINKILISRSTLYSNWFPSYKQKEYIGLVIKQGAEYSTMGTLYFGKYENPIVLAFDHPKMKTFYGLNFNIPVLYGRQMYN